MVPLAGCLHTPHPWRCRAVVPFTGVNMDLLTWIIVGLVAGLLASAVVGGVGYGLLGDIVVGMVGAVLGGWLFSTLGISLPIPGLAGTILVAFIGAVVLLLLIRAVSRRGPRT